jgi:hypothetical protein
VDWIYLAQDIVQWRALVNTVKNIWVLWNMGDFLTSWVTISFSRRALLHGVSSLYRYRSCSKMKMTVFWDVTPCSLVWRWVFALMMEIVSTSETSLNFYQTTRRNIPKDGHLHTRRRENLKSHTVDRCVRTIAVSCDERKLHRVTWEFMARVWVCPENPLYFSIDRARAVSKQTYYTNSHVLSASLQHTHNMIPLLYRILGSIYVCVIADRAEKW